MCCAVLCLAAQSCLTLCDPMDCSQAPLSMGFSRQEYWSGLPCPPPGDLFNPGVKPRSPTLQVDSLSTEPPGKPYRWILGRFFPHWMQCLSLSSDTENVHTWLCWKSYSDFPSTHPGTQAVGAMALCEAGLQIWRWLRRLTPWKKSYEQPR